MTLRGGHGQDVIEGGIGDDQLYGGGGRNTLYQEVVTILYILSDRGSGEVVCNRMPAG